MKLLSKLVLAVLFVLTFLSAEENTLVMSTTTSTENSGLLSYLNPVFEKETKIKVKVIALGTGAAIKTAKEGDADLILVHAKAKEDKFVKEGYGIERFSLMHNDFVLIGPKDDKAEIAKTKTITEALKEIAKTNSIFVSRGDDSGTHSKEQDLWESTGLELTKKTSTLTKKGKKREISFVKPIGKWYFSIGQGMGNTINFAYEKNGYTLTDRGTYLAYKDKVDLIITSEGDKRLFNPYGIIAVNPKKHPHVNIEAANKYINWIRSERIQKMIANFKIKGEQLFIPDVH